MSVYVSQTHAILLHFCLLDRKWQSSNFHSFNYEWTLNKILCLQAICTYFMKYLFIVFVHFSLEYFLSTLRIISSIVCHMLQIISPCHLHFLAFQKYLIFMKSHLSIFSPMASSFRVMSGNILLSPNYVNIYLCFLFICLWCCFLKRLIL